MTLRRTVAVALISCVAVLVLLVWFLSSRVLGKQFSELETQGVHADLMRLHEALHDQLSDLGRMASDYGHWTDSYNFMANPGDNAYREENFTPDGQTNLKAEHMVLIDTAGNLIAHYGVSIYGNKDSLPFPEKLFRNIDRHSPQVSGARGTHGGWLQVQDSTVYLIGVGGVTPGFDTTKCRGYFYIIRKLGPQVLEQLQKRVGLPVQIDPFAELPTDARVLSQVQDGAGLASSYYQGKEQSVEGSVVKVSPGYLQTGFEGRALFSLQRPRQMEASGHSSLKFLYFGLLLSLLVVGAALTILLHRSVLGPLLDLEKRFNRIGQTGDIHVRVPVRGPEEIRRLSMAINATLDQLREGLRKLEETEKGHRILTEELRNTHSFMTKLVDYLPDATFAVDARGTVMAWNQAMEQLTGVENHEIVGGPTSRVSQLLYGVQRPLLLESFFHPELGTETFPERVLCENGSYQFEEFVAKLDANRGRFLDQSAIALRDGNGSFLGALQTIRDVSDQRKAEIRLEFLSLHDPLTGLFNRTYYAEALNGLSTFENLPIGVMLIDLDGLKLVNDTLGHDHGDALILAAAGMMRKAFPELPVARIGGDEFVIIFSKTPEVTVRAGIERLRGIIDDYNRNEPPMPVQMSMGFSWSDRIHSIGELVKEADSRMYREKDLRRESVRMGYVTNLQRRFEEIHRKDQDSTHRLMGLATRFGQYLQLDDDGLERLKLLSRFRDIGKVGISERIMRKPGQLDADEQAEMRKQPEIGYRIAKISRELSDIAELILKQREWWDGRGYPLGIAGEQIPFLNRILAVVEAYIAMTGPRLRSRSRLPAEAMEEIRLMSGKKLDPQLVETFGAFIEKMG